MSETPLKTLGKYQIRQELGKGAMGVVYLGFDPALEREVALKVMASAIVSDSELKERFEREARSVARLQHPNIVTVYDLGYDDQGAPFIAMERLKGQDLEQRIRRDPLTFREKLDVVAQTCRGLAHAHKKTAWPPSCTMPASKVTRVRRLGFSKIIARQRRANSGWAMPALSFCLSSVARLKMPNMS